VEELRGRNDVKVIKGKGEGEKRVEGFLFIFYLFFGVVCLLVLWNEPWNK